jgi:hypothetical protein
MSTALDQVRQKINAVEDTLPNTGTAAALCSQKLKDAGVEQTHRAIIACLKEIAEVLVRQDALLEKLQESDASRNRF